MRMNAMYDRIRSSLGRSYPDKAESARMEIVTILALLAHACEDLSKTGKTRRLPLYEQGTMYKALGLPFEDGRYEPVEMMNQKEVERLLT